MRDDDVYGFAAGLEAPPPLAPECARAMHCWIYCRGWEPERLPFYAALHGIADWELTVHLLENIRQQVPN